MNTRKWGLFGTILEAAYYPTTTYSWDYLIFTSLDTDQCIPCEYSPCPVPHWICTDTSFCCGHLTSRWPSWIGFKTAFILSLANALWKVCILYHKKLLECKPVLVQCSHHPFHSAIRGTNQEVLYSFSGFLRHESNTSLLWLSSSRRHILSSSSSLVKTSFPRSRYLGKRSFFPKIHS